MTGLRSLLSPISLDSFLDDYWQERALVCLEGSAGKFNDLISLDLIDEFFASRNLSREQLRVVRNDTQISPSMYIDGDEPWSSVSRDAALKHFSQGATLVFNGVQRYFTDLAKYCGQIADELKSKVHANLYITPPGTQAFLAHYDSHDVFVLQIQGEKNWRLYKSATYLPLPSHPYSDVDPSLEVSDFFTLKPGSYCYIPRGLIHEAAATVSLSMHITIGITSPLWVDILKGAINEFAKCDPGIRRVISGAYKKVTEDSVREEAVSILDRLQKSDAIAKEYFRVLALGSARSNGNLEGRLKSIASSDAVCEDSVVERIRPFKIEDFEGGILLTSGRLPIRFPEQARRSLTCLASGSRFKVGDIDGDIDANGRLVLVRRLVREEFLRLVDP